MRSMISPGKSIAVQIAHLDISDAALQLLRTVLSRTIQLHHVRAPLASVLFQYATLRMRTIGADES